MVCSIGSLDPTGAAGIMMDLRVYADLGAIGVAVVAAVTAQNSKRVVAVGAIPPTLITQQLEAVWEQVKPDAICIGLLPEASGIKAVRRFLQRVSRRRPIVIDPVMQATSGKRFVGPSELRELVQLLPLATVVTPNLREVSEFVKKKIMTADQAELAARKLTRHGCAVLVTGGHLTGDVCVDALAQHNRVRRFRAPRLAGSMRGAGGILAAALAANLARGESLERAVEDARKFVRRALRNARKVGSGTPQYVT
ncbi:MAG TPA: hydroxymethylpyrimidine/phosphomethylpyrimidine kinase [Candidatus Eremiobacteraceae bacterium]|nr:hydroxymethylpyrimidine/phosphomethylpyrimidine kinase [Candidatus Eremiobacteraceae bacterium]